MNASSKNNKPKELRKMSTNSFIIQSQRSISKQNLFRNSFNLLEQKSAKSKHGEQKLHSGFSSCVNLTNQKNIDKNKGLNMVASTIFDQFKNAQIPTKPPSICSKSNNERSTNNLLKNSQSLNEINPQQAHELLQKIYRHDPDKLKLLIREAQLQQTHQQKRGGGDVALQRETMASLQGSATLRKRPPSFKQGRPIQQGFQEPISSQLLLSHQQLDNNNLGNKNFVQNLRNHDKQGKMSMLFDFLHSNQQKTLNQMNVHKIESNAIFEQLMDQRKTMQATPAQQREGRRQSIVQTLNLDAKKKDKSQDEFEDDEDVEVDNLFFDEMQEAEPQNIQNCDLSEMDQQNRALVANLALAQMTQDIEDFQPKLQRQLE